MDVSKNKILLLTPLLVWLLTGFCSAKIELQTQKPTENWELHFSDNTALQSYLDKNFELQFQDKSFSFQPRDLSIWQTNFSPQEGYSSEIEKVTLCENNLSNLPVTPDFFVNKPFSICELTDTIKSTGHFKKGALLKLADRKIDEFVATLSEEIVSAPKNAKLRMVTEKTPATTVTGNNNQPAKEKSLAKKKLEIISPAQSGFSLDEEQTVKLIKNALKDRSSKTVLQLPTKIKEPQISQKTLGDLKIEERVGYGESNFAGSPKNRIHNIYVAVAKFDGILLAPGEEFSFTTLLGPVDKENGYKEELVIKDNKTIPEYGGGICQVSTTVFRSALNAGLKITERRNHAYPVQYYSPQGTDATIYIPKPDLRFINNTPGYLLFQATFSGKKLAFDLFGQSDGRQVTMEGPKVTERTPEGILKVRLKQTVTDKDGELLFEDTFKSVYDNPAKYHETELLKTKPENWSKKQWKAYKAQHNL